MRHLKFVLLILMAWSSCIGLTLAQNQQWKLQSPDGRIQVTISADARLRYQVSVDGQQVLAPSSIDLQLAQQGRLLANPKVVAEQRSEQQQTLRPVVKIKSAEILDHYQQLSLDFEKPITVVFRAFNNGMAYRLQTRIDGEITVVDETVEYDFTANSAKVYFAEEEGFYSHNERTYLHVPVTDITPERLGSLPALVENGPAKLFISETALEDYAGLWLRGDGKGKLVGTLPRYPKTLTLDEDSDRNEPVTDRLDYIAKSQGQRVFPWRILGIARSDGELITNQLVHQLSDPNRIKNPDWVRPGKVAWDWYNANNLFGVDFVAGVNTETYKHYIDFAAEYGIEYVILDEGWYPLGDLLGTVPEMDVPAIIAHAKAKGVGIILWASWYTLKQQFDAAMDHFKALGAVGIKPDFFQRDDQQMVQFYWQIAEAAAERELLVDFHGSYKPAGLHRTYPNVISREGVKGLEWNKWSTDSTAEHNVTLPFIRMTAGPMDYTPGAMVNAQPGNFHISFERPMSQTTRVHQMAMLTVFESPLQMLADTPSNYRQSPDCTAFMAKVPTVWDETRVLQGKIGDAVILARRSGSTWFVAGMTDENAREVDLNLDFLPKGEFTAAIFADGINAKRWASDYQRSERTVNSGTQLTVKMAPSGGWTARITPK